MSSRPLRRFLRGLLPAPLRETYHRYALSRDFGISLRTGERRSARLDPSLEPGVNLIGYFESPSGVGQSARALARAAESAGISIARVDAASLEDASRISAPYAVNVFHVNADGAAAAVELCGPRVHRGRANVGYWYWETELFPRRWRDRFTYFDEIWVASEFCRRALDAVSPIPVAIVPPPVTVGAGEDRRPRAEKTFRFLTLCNASSVPERKNPLGVVRAFVRAFRDDPSVGLTVRVSNPDSAPGLVDGLTRAAESANVEIDTAESDRDGIEERIARCDAYVSLHRAEGFGFPLAEAMALGRPVVATDYSGSRDFLDEETGFPVRWKPVALERAVGPYDEGTRWAEPDEDHAVETLRQVVADRAEAARRAEAGRRRIASRYGVHAAGRRLDARLAMLRARLAARP